MKIESIIIGGIAIIALLLGAFAVYQTTILNQKMDVANGQLEVVISQLGLANSKITTLQNNYNDLLASFNDLKSTVVALNSSLTSVLEYLLQNTNFEKLEIGSAYAVFLEGNATWDVILNVSNTGFSDATITNIFINGMPYTDPLLIEIVAVSPTPAIPLVAGNSITITISIADGTGFTHGQTIDVRLHTAFGGDYPKSVVLP
jgi:hypothetical protein